MKELSFDEMEVLEGGWMNTVGCGAGILLVVASGGTGNIAAFAAGVGAIVDYCDKAAAEW